MSNPTLLTITETSPDSASTVIGTALYGLQVYDFFSIDAALAGATGGTLDVYLQRRVADDVWHDWAAYTQLADGASAVSYSHFAGPGSSSSIVTVGTGTDSTATPALAAGSFVGGHPGSALRVVMVAGSGTSAGAAVSIRLNCWRGR